MNTLPWSRPLTRADLDAWPDDGRRHELIDGCLLLIPVPTVAHQDAVGRLSLCLHQARRTGDLVLHGPFDVVLADDTVVRPDLVVAPRAAYTERDLPVAPDLIVEVSTTNTRWIDLHAKFHRYERAGVAAYWVVDPDTPSLIAWELRDGAYVQVAKVTGDESATLTSPFEVTVVPANLFCR